MPWYYAINNQRFGPYSDQEFSGIVAQGTIAPDTLVWKDGMQDWQPYRLVQGSVPVTPPASPTFNPGLATGGTAMVVCSSCSRTFPEDEVIQYQGAYICAACKPIFQQQLREGAVIGTNRVYGGFWIRLGARIIDGILIGGTFFILALVLGGITAATGGANGEVPGALGILLNLASVFVGVAYETFFIGKYGATLGKMACGLRVITADGGQVSYLRAFARYWATQLSALILMLGYIIAAFDSEKRALHDHICSTRVIRK